MREFKKVDKVFIKSNNNVSKIFNRYLFCLIPFILFILIYNMIWGSSEIAINLIKNTLVSIIITLIFGLIISSIKHEKYSKILIGDNLLTISIIVSLCSLEAPLIVVGIASGISIIVRYLFKNITISSSLYGILTILLYTHFANNISTPLTNLKELMYIGSYEDVFLANGNILSYVLGLKYYLSPIISILIFIYLFIKKSIKYNIIFSYTLTFMFVMLFTGLMNDMNVWYLLFQLCTGNILFLMIFGLVDYPNTPIIFEGQIIYGIILGLISSILRFIIPTFSVVITLILGPILFTKKVNKLSIKLKTKKLFNLSIVASIVVTIVVTIIINILI